MNKLNLLLCALLVTFTVGCTGLASVAKQLKDDPAFVTVDVRTLYGTGRLVRDGRAANGNNVTLDAVASIQPQPPVFGPPTQIVYVTNTVVLGLTTNVLTPSTVNVPIAR
jgi:hypothetical protein